MGNKSIPSFTRVFENVLSSLYLRYIFTQTPIMRKKYDREAMFEKVSESYELDLSPVAYCARTNFPIKVFYRYRQQYIKVYGEAPMPSRTASFVALEAPTSVLPTGLRLEIGSHIRLCFDSLPDAAYLSKLLNSLPHASFK